MKRLALILVFLASAISWAQSLVDTTYQVELTTTASPMVSFFRHPRVPGTINEPVFGYGVFVRGMWHPGRLLSVGLMTGYLFIAQDEIPVDGSPAGGLNTPIHNYSARLTAIPLQVAITMQKHGLELGLGIGPYLMMSIVEGGNGAPAHGQRLELGTTFFGSYVFSLSDNIKVGPELRVLHLHYRGVLSVMPSCSFRVNALRY